MFLDVSSLFDVSELPERSYELSRTKGRVQKDLIVMSFSPVGKLIGISKKRFLRETAVTQPSLGRTPRPPSARGES